MEAHPLEGTPMEARLLENSTNGLTGRANASTLSGECANESVLFGWCDWQLVCRPLATGNMIPFAYLLGKERKEKDWVV
eukprot:scaffold245702_cov21-Tisochrysis_lutea.AAC.1